MPAKHQRNYRTLPRYFSSRTPKSASRGRPHLGWRKTNSRLSLSANSIIPPLRLPTHEAGEHSQHREKPHLSPPRPYEVCPWFPYRLQSPAETPIPLARMSGRAVLTRLSTPLPRRVLLALLTHNELPLPRTRQRPMVIVH